MIKLKNKYKIRVDLTAIALFVVLLFSCSSPSSNKVDSVVEMKVQPFKMSQVKLLEGPFYNATQLNQKVLLQYHPDRFLARFRIYAGLEPKAEPYGGWEAQSLAGHSLGHYLTALSQMYLNTGNPEFLERANYIVDELDLIQNKIGTGYIGAFDDGEKILMGQIAKGQIDAKGFDLNGLWSPFYTIHKLLDGLHNVYLLLDNDKALLVEQAFADWVGLVLKDLNHAQLQEMLNCEFGGMNDALVNLYVATGSKKYLDDSYKFNHQFVIEPVIEGTDELAGKHVNTQIPKFIGLASRYEVTGNSDDFKGASNFWHMAVHHHAYVAGNFGNYEYFSEPDKLNQYLSNNMCETCCTYNMLKLSEHLFQWDASVEVMDYYERALINHILSSQHSNTGKVVYNLSLDMGGFKEYQNPYDFTCCIGTGMENHSKYNTNIYYHNDDALYITQFIASQLTWEDKNIVLKQITQFPEEEGTTIVLSTLNGSKSIDLDLKIRYPKWAHQGIHVKKNGKILDLEAKRGTFVSLGEKWKSGDTLHISMPFDLYRETMPDNDSRIALFHGPLLLSGVLGSVEDEKAAEALYVPVLMTKETDPNLYLLPQNDDHTYKLSNVAYPRQVILQPFYRTQDVRYTVYWDTYSTIEWKRHQKEYTAQLAAKKALEQKTIDVFRLGEMQPERDHNFKEFQTWVSVYKSKKYREVDAGGSATFDMKVNDEFPMAMVFEYWGGFAGSHTFDIIVDGKVLATENITNKAPGSFINVTYPLSKAMTEGKSKVKVELKPHDGHRAGPVFTVRTINAGM